MFITDGKLAICTGCEVKVEVENNVFANSLLGTTIQDGGTRERSNGYFYMLELKTIDFVFLSYFYFLFYLFSYLGLRVRISVTAYVTVTTVTHHDNDKCHRVVTQSYNTKKVGESSETDNAMLA